MKSIAALLILLAIAVSCHDNTTQEPDPVQLEELIELTATYNLKEIRLKTSENGETYLDGMVKHSEDYSEDKKGLDAILSQSSTLSDNQKMQQIMQDGGIYCYRNEGEVKLFLTFKMYNEVQGYAYTSKEFNAKKYYSIGGISMKLFPVEEKNWYRFGGTYQ